MEKFTVHQGLVVPLDRANVDTDAIIPKQYLKSIKRSGYGPTLFDEWRYLEPGEPGMDHSQRTLQANFILNQARYQSASILLARDNFGCGSSREHAVWALSDYGFRAVVAPSFADIFFNNSFKNGLLPVVLPAGVIDALFEAVASTPGYKLVIDLEPQLLTTPDGQQYAFDVEAFRKGRLLRGLDDIGLTLQQASAICDYETKRREEAPWLFN